MTKRFKNKVAVITGAAQGIGHGVALRMAKEGAQLVLVDRSELVFELRDQLKKKKVDVLVNNVGGTIWTKPFEHYQENEIEAEVRRSLFPTLWCCHAVLPYMLKQQSGAIVNVSSIATRSINRVPYGAAKGGVNAMTACLAFENAQRGIRVNAIATGGTEAPPRRVPRNTNEQTEQEKAWYQQIIDQTVDSTLMKRYGTIDETLTMAPLCCLSM